jgi:glycosyltransferase involved in cell wall biosynthesis
VDSGSTDETVKIAREAGATVWERSFDNYSAQRNWTLEKLLTVFAPRWILSIDADEQVTPRLAQEIQKATTPGNDDDTDVFLLTRRLEFCGRVLRFGGYSRTRLPRLFRAGMGTYEPREVNEHFMPVPGARVATLRGHILHQDVASWERHIAKHNSYSTREARVRLSREASGGSRVTLREVMTRPYLRRRWLRESVFEQLPLKPVFRFIYLYVFLGGFLDGRSGLNNAIFQAWQELCTELKYQELIRERSG